VTVNGQTIESGDIWQTFQETVEASNKIHEEIRHIEKDLIGAINYKMERLRLQERRLEIKGNKT